MSSTLGFGDSVSSIKFGRGLNATDPQGNPLTVFDGTQPVILQAAAVTAVNYNTIANLPKLFDGDYNSLYNRPAILQGVAGQSIVGSQGLPGKDGVNGQDGISVVGPQGLPGKDGADSTVAGPPGQAGKNGVDSTIAGPTGATGATGAASTIAGPQGATGATGAASTIAGPQGPSGPAPAGSAGQVVYLASSGVAAATANLVLNTTNITSLNPFYSNVIAGSGSSIPYATLTGAPTLSFLPLAGGTLTGNLVATNITATSIWRWDWPLLADRRERHWSCATRHKRRDCHNRSPAEHHLCRHPYEHKQFRNNHCIFCEHFIHKCVRYLQYQCFVKQQLGNSRGWICVSVTRTVCNLQLILFLFSTPNKPGQFHRSRQKSALSA